MYSVSQVLFILLFLSLLLLLLVFGETTLGIVFLGLLVLLCLYSATHIKLDRVKAFVVPLGILGLFVVGTFLSLLTTISIPLTINTAMFYAGAYVVFFTLLCCDPDWLPPQLLMMGSCILGVIFAGMTILYTVLPALATSLPTVTLLTAQYGHNQASTLFLFIFPIVWNHADLHKKKIARFAAVMIFIALLLSFSRVATVLALGQLVVLSLHTMDQKLRNLGRLLLGVLITAVVIMSISSTIGHHSASGCPFPILQDKLCKDIHREMRPAYWTQAVDAAAQRPAEGWGGGTFALLSPLLQKNYGEYSGYAHNEILHAFAEYGVSGGIPYLLFIVYIGYIASRHVLQGKRGVIHGLALGLLCVIITSFFNFGLHMLGLWIFFLLGSSVLISQSSSLLQFEFSKGKNFSKVLLGVFFIFALTVLSWTAAFTVSEVLLSKGKRDLSLRVFPLAYWRVEESLQKDSSSSQTNEWLLRLYQNHYRVWDALASSPNLPQAEKAVALKKGITLDPMSQYRYFPYINAAIESGDARLIAEAVSMWKELLNSGFLDSYTYEENGQVAGLVIVEANRLIVAQQIAQALQLYQNAYQIQSEQFGMYDIALFKKIEELPITELLPLLSAVEYQVIYKQADDLYRGESAQLVSAILKGNALVSSQLVRNIVRLGGEYDWKLQDLITSTCKKPTQRSPDVLLACVESILSWEKNTTTGSTFDYDVKQDVAKQIVQHARDLQISNPAQADVTTTF